MSELYATTAWYIARVKVSMALTGDLDFSEKLVTIPEEFHNKNLMLLKGLPQRSGASIKDCINEKIFVLVVSN